MIRFDKAIWQPQCTSSRCQGLIWGLASPCFINEPVTTMALLGSTVVWHRNMVQYIRFKQAFCSGCSRVMYYPLLHCNSYRGWGQTLSLRLSVFQLPAVSALPLPTPISSPTRSICAPGTVLYSQPLPTGALSSGAVPDSAGPLLLFHQKPASASKKEHDRPGASPKVFLPSCVRQ
jgi:hypothetical protein